MKHVFDDVRRTIDHLEELHEIIITRETAGLLSFFEAIETRDHELLDQLVALLKNNLAGGSCLGLPKARQLINENRARAKELAPPVNWRLDNPNNPYYPHYVAERNDLERKIT